MTKVVWSVKVIDLLLLLLMLHSGWKHFVRDKKRDILMKWGILSDYFI